MIGFMNDHSLIIFNIIQRDSYQYGNLALWIVFLLYYEHIFHSLSKKSLIFNILLGGLGGVTSYWSAVKLGSITLIPGSGFYFILSQFLFWAIFFPISLKLYYVDDYWKFLLDFSVIFSFDKSGFIRHQEEFKENLSTIKLTGKNSLVTGGTGGIGNGVASILSKLDSKVFITGRNQVKGTAFEKDNPNSKFLQLDMANWEDVFHFARNSETFDLIVFNAGSMPEAILFNKEGVEVQCASQLLGHYFLLVWLKKFNKLKYGARVVWVSSGGMYLKKLNVDELFNNLKYDKVETYANVKRAQVTLVEELAKLNEWKDFNIFSMHPGWVKTDGLKDALPHFYNFLEKRLRNEDEGADTIVWCLITQSLLQNGGFYFDRKKVRPYVLSSYNPYDAQRKRLIELIEDKMNNLSNVLSCNL